MGDPVPGGWRGFAALLAEATGAEFHNLAVSGALSADVEREQLPRALELRPDIASVVVGVNDTLRRTFDVGRIAGAMAHTIGALRAAGATVLTMRLPDPGRMFGLPGSLARPLARRTRAVNVVTDELAARFDTVHFNVATHPDTYDRRMWSVDRLHPSERGHRLVARGYADLLGLPGDRWPDAEPSNPTPTRRAQLGWLATKGSRWVVDRSTDLVPYLIGMTFVEWWYGLRDTAVKLDASLARTTAAALAALPAGAGVEGLPPPVRLEEWPDLTNVNPMNCAPSR
jgi:lysophospholipase L1-like esterase